MAPTPKNHFGIRRPRNRLMQLPLKTAHTPISSKQPPFPIPFSFHSQDVVPDLTVFSIVILIMDRIEQKSNCSDVTLPIEISPFYTSPPMGCFRRKIFLEIPKVGNGCCLLREAGPDRQRETASPAQEDEREATRHSHAPPPPREDLRTMRTQFRKSARSSRTLAATSGAWVTSVTIAM